ncbi:MAG: hypothetical protein SGARI_007560, partial [Bacillariaceae sp.]
MAECCLIADVIQYFKDNNIDYCPTNTVNDILGAIRDTHISGDFHRIVANNPEMYFDPTPHLKAVLNNLKDSGKRLIFARSLWDVIVVSAGKPAFYTESRRPFREVETTSNHVRFQKVEKLRKSQVYTGGCLQELTRLMDWSLFDDNEDGPTNYMGALSLNSNVLYIGDSLFADLVDAKREFGWITAAVTPEVGFEMEVQKKKDFILVDKTIGFLLNALRLIQAELGTKLHTEEDAAVLDKLENLVSKWRDRETALLGNPFGSVFRARYQPSLFAHSLRRYCDLYMNS